MSKSAVSRVKIGKLVFVVLLAVMFFSASASSNVYAKTKKAKYGTIKILSTPSGLPILVDGKAYGVTSPDYRSIDLDPGLHTVVIILPDGQRWTREIDLPAGRIKCVALNYRPGIPAPKSPCPFPVNVSAPTQVNEGEIITYTADVAYSGTAPLLYNWSVSPGNARVVSGAGTPTITVDSTGLAGQRITATLVVDDGSGDASCRQTSQVATNIPPVEKRVVVGREFDTCCSCSYDDLKARLDNLAVELQNDPSTTTYIFAYGGRTSPSGQAGRLLARSRDYLITDRGIDDSRIVQVNGGFREEDCVEVWIVPRGATPPRPSPTVQPSEVRPAPQTAPRRRPRG
jgi:hypothetical protein